LFCDQAAKLVATLTSRSFLGGFSRPASSNISEQSRHHLEKRCILTLANPDWFFYAPLFQETPITRRPSTNWLH